MEKKLRLLLFVAILERNHISEMEIILYETPSSNLHAINGFLAERENSRVTKTISPRAMRFLHRTVKTQRASLEEF